MTKKVHAIDEPLTGTEKVKSELLCLFCCTLASVIMAFNLQSFVNTGELFPGGFAGLTLLVLRSLTKFAGITLPYSAIYLPLNAVPIIIGLRFLGRKFTMYSIYVTVLTSVLTDLFPQIPITYDILLICLFGGIINGAAISLCLLVGASGGGTDFISIFMSERKGIDTYNYIFAANVVILAVAGLLFGWDKALYSIVYQFCTTQVIQRLFRRYNKTTLMIVTDLPEVVYDKIRTLTNHDATLFKGEGLYMGQTKNMLYSVIDSDEVGMLISVIHEVDPHAFINAMKTEQLSGRFYSRPKR
ncbi:MAG: YitT family protein [Eubacterium sp.]|nr:YitT family protein [Eubacterium sp.]